MAASRNWAVERAAIEVLPRPYRFSRPGAFDSLSGDRGKSRQTPPGRHFYWGPGANSRGATCRLIFAGGPMGRCNCAKGEWLFGFVVIVLFVLVVALLHFLKGSYSVNSSTVIQEQLTGWPDAERL